MCAIGRSVRERRGMARAAAARRDPPSFQLRRAASVLLLLSALGAASSASPPVDTGEELVGVAQLRAFLDESHYVPGEPGAAANHAARVSCGSE